MSEDKVAHIVTEATSVFTRIDDDTIKISGNTAVTLTQLWYILCELFDMEIFLGEDKAFPFFWQTAEKLDFALCDEISREENYSDYEYMVLKRKRK